MTTETTERQNIDRQLQLSVRRWQIKLDMEQAVSDMTSEERRDFLDWIAFYVREIARLGVLVVALAFAGCAQFETTLDRITWALDDECEAGERELDAIDGATALWSEWGVEVVPAIGIEADVIVCWHAEQPAYNVSGWARTGRIDMDSRPERQVGLVAHELGHLILFDTPAEIDHLSRGLIGIMAGDYQLQPSDDAWSASDVRHLERLGLSRVP